MKERKEKGFIFFHMAVVVLIIAAVIWATLYAIIREHNRTEELIKNSAFEAKIENFELKFFQLSFGPREEFQNRAFFFVRFDRPVKILTQDKSLSSESREFWVDLDNRTGYKGHFNIDYVEVFKALEDRQSRKWIALSSFNVYLKGVDDSVTKRPVISYLAVLDTEQK